MKKVIIFLLIGILAFGAVACSQSIKTTTSQIITSDASKTDTENLVYGNNTFALELYQSLKGSEGNLFYSPFSISSALAMTYAGARGETADQMEATLHFLLPQSQLHTAFKNISDTITNRVYESDGAEIEGFMLRNVNALWGLQGYPFLDSFLNTLTENYGSELTTLDFINEPEESRIIINDWVSERTENRINNLLQQGAITPFTRLVLTNAIYFKAGWLYEFYEGNTIDGTFNLIDDKTVSVPMMKQTETFKYGKGTDYQAIELMYRGQATSMVIILPANGHFESFQDNLDYPILEGIIKNMEHEKVNLTLPKFEFSADFELGKTLEEMGMPLAFTEQADFTGMADTYEPLFISKVIHKAFVAVDEKGTEAAAATAAIIVVTAPAKPVDMNIDRPFIFLIRDMETDAIMFIGRVMNPLE
ncbi:MAG: serpin family protein [Dehalococcoidales bacterium]|nr:serpin family protein [Dehalococcoidales bacterium]